MVFKYVPRRLLEVTAEGIKSMHPECTKKVLAEIAKCKLKNNIYGVSAETYSALIACSKVACPECREKLRQLVLAFAHSVYYKEYAAELSDIRQLNRLSE